MTWTNIRNIRTVDLERFLRRYAIKLEHKRVVQSKHQLGTTYHTRATREIDSIIENVHIVVDELNRRKLA